MKYFENSESFELFCNIVSKVGMFIGSALESIVTLLFGNQLHCIFRLRVLGKFNKFVLSIEVPLVS